MMKIYTFLDFEGNVIENVRAETHDEALLKTVNTNIDFKTDFVSSDIYK